MNNQFAYGISGYPVQQHTGHVQFVSHRSPSPRGSNPHASMGGNSNMVPPGNNSTFHSNPNLMQHNGNFATSPTGHMNNMNSMNNMNNTFNNGGAPPPPSTTTMSMFLSNSQHQQPAVANPHGAAPNAGGLYSTTNYASNVTQQPFHYGQASLNGNSHNFTMSNIGHPPSQK